MIRTVADLRRALDAYPDDMPIITSGVDGFGEEEIVLADPVRVEEEPMGQDPWAGELPKSFTKAIHAYGSYIRL